MELAVEMTGKQDREGPWKIAIGGFAGSGKTLFASTAPDPLFVFFQENPRIKSIARRHIPHVKLLNRQTSGGLVTAQDMLQILTVNLEMAPHTYKTLVIDTGDELFQSMKAGRRLKNGGEFGISDWGWIADAYRGVMETLVDLPMTVIVLYHIKATQDGGDEGYVVRDLLLQGQAQAEVPGWFDVVGVMETFEAVGEDGDTTSKRVILTRSSRMYPWLKDHSGALPAKFEISDNFVGDFDRFYGLLIAEDSEFKEGQEHQVVEVMGRDQVEAAPSGQPVPSPEDVKEKKRLRGVDEPATVEVTEGSISSGEAETGVEDSVLPQPSQTESLESENIIRFVPDMAQAGTLTEESISSGEEAFIQPQPSQTESPSEVMVSEEQAVENVQELLGGEEIFICSVCSEPVEDVSLREISQIRFRKYLCRPHFKEELHKSKVSS